MGDQGSGYLIVQDLVYYYGECWQVGGVGVVDYVDEYEIGIVGGYCGQVD